jgi:stigma-specific protein Stig1
VNLTTDDKNCGKCATVCPMGQVCTNGACAASCGAPLMACNGMCVDTRYDPNNCKTCNNVCTVTNGTAGCLNGACFLASCNNGFTNCTGACVNLQTDVKNCGACANACAAGALCVSGKCVLTKVLLVYAVPVAAWATEVQGKLQAFPDFAAVDLFNAQTATPTLAQLQAYQVIMVFSDTPFVDPVTLGNNVADYYDGGGRVVIAVFANASLPITGRFGTVANGYMLINPTGQEQPTDSLGVVSEPNSPLMLNVKTLSATAAYRSTGGPVNGGIVTAAWSSNGRPLIVHGVIKGRNRVDINMYPPSSASRADFWTGDGAQIMRNALVYQ